MITSKPRWDGGAKGSPPPWRAATISNHLALTAARVPGKTAITFGSRTLTWAELDALATRAATGILALGARPGDVVGLRAHNSPETLAAFYGLARAGVTILPLNPRLVVEELRWQLADVEAVRLIDDDGLGDVTAAEVVARGGERPCDVGVSEDDYVWVRFTSGTTGRSKAVATTQGSGAYLFEAMAFELGQRPSDITLVSAPIAHAAVATAATAVLLGGTIVLEPRFDPATVWRTCDEHAITQLFMVPTMFALSLGQPGDGQSIRGFLSMASIFSPALKARVKERFPLARLHDSYGGTEVGAATILHYDDRPDKAASVGLPAFGYRVRVLGDDGRPLPPGEVGTLYLQGRPMAAAFVGSEEPQPGTLRDGFLTMGDLGYLDEEGFVYLVDRRTDLIVSGGYNVYPSEVENVLLGHPGVVNAAVVGVADDTWGQIVTAVVQGAAAPDELDALCRRELAGYKVPRRFETVDALPVNASGKVLKRELRALLSNQSDVR